MEPEDIRALRRELRMSMRDLADRLEVDTALVMAWESGEKYPTRRHVERMRALSEGRLAPVERKRDLFEGFLSDPRFHAAFRKLLAYPELQEEFLEIAEPFEDPAK